MATFYRRPGRRGVRWTARVRVRCREVTRTFGTKSAAEAWARTQEGAIERGEFGPVERGAGVVFADLVDAFLGARAVARRPLGKSASGTITRLKTEHGLEPATALDAAFWRRHVYGRIRAGASSQTAAADLSYAASILAFGRREGLLADASGPSVARAGLRDDGLRIASRSRDRRLSDEELEALLAACDRVASHVPVGDIVRFALATAMRRGEILRLRWTDVDAGRRAALVRNRKHPRDRERVDEVPLVRPHTLWPRWDAVQIIARQPRGGALIFPYHGDTLGERFERACKLAGLHGVVFHLLRHEALSRYAQQRRFDPLRLQLIGGHRDLRHLTRYVRLSASELAIEP